MFSAVITKLIGSSNSRVLKRLQKTVTQINNLESEFEALTDQQLKDKTPEFKERLANGEELDNLLVEAFATVREASKRVLGMRPFDVQLMGGIVLNENCIAEMRTGEGKTLTATLPCYLNALTGRGVHVVTVNDYLAKRDAETNKPLFEFLGMSVAVNVPGLEPSQKQAAYKADITYVTNSELGFDYLRDNLAHSNDEKFQRDLYYALVDEVDSILIDEARTPLIISGPSNESTELYIKVDKIIPSLIQQAKEDSDDFHGDGDYYLDLKNKQAFLTERGQLKIEQLLVKAGLMQEDESLYAPNNLILVHHINAALRAHTLFEKDVEYIVKDNEVIIIDEHTGRPMDGRRWSDGLHQAIEAKEHVEIKGENQTVASITYQNYFRLYEKLAGMTGTADTEAFEFQQIYHLNTVVIPTNKPMIRDDRTDLLYASEDEKFHAIVEDIKDCMSRQQPVLVGTVSIEKSEKLSRLLDSEHIKHNVLNAKFHAKEAEIVADAGSPGAVTIATNMAGRGTDIVLGGNWQTKISQLENPTEQEIEEIKQKWQQRHDQVVAAGGLHIIGTERHDSRRIDNQLRGRSGRQGDPGSSRFYLSLDDNLLKIYLSEGKLNLMRKGFSKPNEALESRLLAKTIESAQTKVEKFHFEARKSLLDYDDVANDQRHAIYEQRNEILSSDDISDTIKGMRKEVLSDIIDKYLPENEPEDSWDYAGLETVLRNEFALDIELDQLIDKSHVDVEELKDKIIKLSEETYQNKVDIIGADGFRQFEKGLMLQTLDELWKEHLSSMDYLRKGIHFRGYAQKDPKQEYKKEAFHMFILMLDRIKYNVISVLSRIQIRSQEEIEKAQAEQEEQARKAAANTITNQEINEDQDGTNKKSKKKIGRNEPCPCGSGKKYKQCHGRIVN